MFTRKVLHSLACHLCLYRFNWGWQLAVCVCIGKRVCAGVCARVSVSGLCIKVITRQSNLKKAPQSLQQKAAAHAMPTRMSPRRMSNFAGEKSRKIRRKAAMLGPKWRRCHTRLNIIILNFVSDINGSGSSATGKACTHQHKLTFFVWNWAHEQPKKNR